MGLIANLLSVLLLHRDAHGSLNIRASYCISSATPSHPWGVLAGGIAIRLWNVFWIEPVITLLISYLS